VPGLGDVASYLERESAKRGKAIVTKITETIIPSRAANHKVIGGNRQNITRQIQSPGRLVVGGIRTNAAATNIAVGPRMYTPARTQPHLGTLLAATQAIRATRASPIKEARFSVIVLTFHRYIAESTTVGSQNANPPTTTQKSFWTNAARTGVTAILASNHVTS
jgi:hypothetical protein